MALALASVRPAAEAILTGNLKAYARKRTQMGRTAERLGRLLLKMGRTEARASWVITSGARLIPMLMDVAVGR